MLPLMILSTEIDNLIEREIYRVEVEIECDSCPETEEPVCATNGNTFTNICELICERAVFLHIGNCMMEAVGANDHAHWSSKKRERMLPMEVGRFK